MGTDPDEASDDMKNAMSFFLNTVIPCVDPDVGRKQDWLGAHGGTLMEKFAGCWHYEMATALLILQEYSDTENLEHNANIPADNDLTSETSAKKKRKRLHSKHQRKGLQDCYYGLCKKMQILQQESGFGERMAAWERACSPNKHAKQLRGPGDRVNVVPTEHRAGANNTENSFLDFIQGNPQFCDIFNTVTPGSPDEPCPPLGQAREVPITQEGV